MVKYRKTKKRLFSKLKKNGRKKRISQKNRLRKYKKRMGGDAPNPPNPPSQLGKRKQEDSPLVDRNDLERERVLEHLAQTQAQPQGTRRPATRERFGQQGRFGPPETYTPVVEFNDNGQKMFRCPVCNLRSGTAAPLTPQDLSLTPHAFDCVNTGKVPVER